jgi:Outer membrane protein beta-barrel domain
MKCLLYIFCFFCWVIQSVAQDSLSLAKYYPKPKITAIEFLVGPSSSSIRGIDESVSSMGGGTYYINTVMNKIGYSMGVGLLHNFNKHFELHARFLWERKGIEEKTDSVSIALTGMLLGEGTLSKHDTRNDYITISIVPQLLLGKRARFNIGTGVYFGLLKESRIKNEYFYPIPHSYSHKGNYDKYDFGLSFNVGYTFSLDRNLWFTIQFLDSYGINQISNWHKSYGFSPWYNNSYSLLLGVRFTNKKTRLKLI